METNVSQLLQEPVGATRHRDIDAVIGGIDDRENPVHGICRLLRTRLGVLAMCELDIDLEMTCDRCLVEFNHQLHISFNEEFVPTVDVVSGMELPAPEDAGTFTIDEHHILDIEEAVRQYAVMALPLKPLCRKDCAGLCPACGRILNEGPCGCPPTETESPWAKLKKLQ